VLRLLVALNDATAALLAQRLDLPVAVVELLLSELEEAGLITGDTVHWQELEQIVHLPKGLGRLREVE
jgi:DNA-binding IclR family transcriptional regulator